MTKPLVDLVAGARPNFIKLAPVERALSASGQVRTRIVHTGQHFDQIMSDVFFQELEIPEPALYLEASPGTHGSQTAQILERYESVLLADVPSATVVFGDVNSTLAAALAAVKLGIKVVHVEAGLRSFDRSMPEEINRILTDAISDLLLVSEPSGLKNLAAEGISPEKTRLVGNVMIDTLEREERRARELGMPARLGLSAHEYALLTLHRPSNVDEYAVLARLIETVCDLSRQLRIVFPVHPRTRAALSRNGLMADLERSPGVTLLEPLSYLHNLGLMMSSRLIMTDSGGIQEEATVLGIPCLTMRSNTERPVTVEKGTSRLVGNDPDAIRISFSLALRGRWPEGEPIELWDGHAGERVAREIESLVTHR
ncbi:MAG: UDP-N-acetylglucosamine 2-epimerase (non-hydrolyzing) [Thermoanaerobaculia bacterium]|nr:UDP-N-acetylglucosamine 2-epimerase (non-hydrolyzing) [Thermoanaerobaculia bacterium]